MSPERQLEAGAKALGLSLANEQRTRLLGFVDLLLKWNKTYNLTAIRNASEVVSHHLLDSMSVLPVLRKSVLAVRREGGEVRLADIGSGAGLPGLVLAMLEPDWRITSVDAVTKKAAFQRQACIELGLKNVEVMGTRVETLPVAAFDAVVSRAFAALDQFVRLAGHLVAPSGKLYAMKGALSATELAQVPGGWQATSAEPLLVPGLDAKRHLIVLEKADSCISLP